ncbi:MAG: GAF domain-containing protein, partial [Synergistaceae bacterium]|nr:GAF domain-containing protein [Synergistaceae bacterium]
MNKLKELARRYIFSDELPLDARMINVICAVGLASAILATVARVVTRADAMMIVIMLAISLSIGLFLIVCNRYHLYRVSTWITLIALCDILFPVAFFMLGGSDSGMAAFFVIGLAVIVILSRGFIRVLLISTNVFLVVSCYVIAYRLPFLTFELDPLGQTLDNIQSFLISGFFIGLVVLFQHIMYDAERRKAESSARKLEIARQSIVTMFESNPHINILFNENFDIIDCNPAAVKFLKFSSKEEMLSGFAELIPNIIPKIQPEGRESIPMSKRLRAAADNGSVKFVTALRVDGETKTLNVEMRRLPYGNGFAIVGHIVDLTAIHQARRDIMRRDMLSQAVSDAATLLLSPDIDRFESSLMSGMEKMALCVDVDRVYIWKNHVENGVLVYKREFQWLSERTEDGRSEVEKQPFKFPYIDSIPEWEAKFSSGQVVRGPVSELSLTEREVLSAYGVKSILAIPIILDDKFWGFVSFDDCRKEREFSDAEEGILRSGCLLLANAIMRNENDRVLKKRLEQQALMSDISQSFISKENTSDLVNGALRKMGEFLGVTRVLIVVSDEKSGETHPAYMWAGSDKIETRPVLTGINELIGGSFPKLLPSRGSIPTVRCGDISSEEKFSPLSATGLISFIWAPLYVDGRYWGLLSVEECFKPRDWSESDAQLAGMVSGAVSGAVARDLMDRERSKALEQAVQASRAKGEFLSNMSHEMRTPMNAIIGMTTVGLSATDIGRKDHCLQRVSDASAHLLGIINDVLDISKIEANKLELSYVSFNFRKMIGKAVDVIDFRVDERRQKLQVDIDDAIPDYIITDDQRLTQVMTNLLSNAVKFTPEEGTIGLSAHMLESSGDLFTVQMEV